jgi:hypothetical protein
MLVDVRVPRVSADRSYRHRRSRDVSPAEVAPGAPGRRGWRPAEAPRGDAADRGRRAAGSRDQPVVSDRLGGAAGRSSVRARRRHARRPPTTRLLATREVPGRPSPGSALRSGLRGDAVRRPLRRRRSMPPEHAQGIVPSRRSGASPAGRPGSSWARRPPARGSPAPRPPGPGAAGRPPVPTSPALLGRPPATCTRGARPPFRAVPPFKLPEALGEHTPQGRGGAPGTDRAREI